MSNKPETKLSKLREELESRAGQDGVLSFLIRENFPLTAENYVNANWPNGFPEEPDPEDVELVNLLKAYEAETKPA